MSCAIRGAFAFISIFFPFVADTAVATRTSVHEHEEFLLSPRFGSRPRGQGSCAFFCPACIEHCVGCPNGCCAHPVCVTRHRMTQNEANQLCGALDGDLAPAGLVQGMLTALGIREPVWTNGIVKKVVKKSFPILAALFGKPPKVKVFTKGRVVHPDGSLGKHKRTDEHKAVCVLNTD